MASREQKLEQELREAGEKLLNLPTEVNQLLPLLDNVESLLSEVEQSPSGTIQNAYSQSMKALIAEPLLKHADIDVKVAVASCISEITRITAPEAPYDDDRMKEVFQVIVSSFAYLSNRSSRSYTKLASILETVAKVRSCVVMLDLECDDLIAQMFQHFLSSIRDYHEEIIFTSMETIMTLVLEESEDVSLELLGPMLASLRLDNEEVSPIARKLGECVFEKCADKLKPYLVQAVKTLGLPLDRFSKIIATICSGANSEIDHKEEDVAEEQQLADDSKLIKTSSDEIAQGAKERVPKEACLEEGLPEVEKSVKPVLSNGMEEAGEKDKLNVSDSSKKPDEGNHSTLNMDVNLNKVNTDDLETETLAKVNSKQEKTPKRRGRKQSSKPSLTEPTDALRVESDKESEMTPLKVSDEPDKLPDVEKDNSKDADISVGEDSHVSPEKEKELEPPISSIKLSESVVDVSPVSPSKSFPDESLPEKVDVSNTRENLAEEDASSVNPAPGKVNAETSGIVMKPEGHSEKQNLAQEAALPMAIVSSKADDLDSDSEVNPQNTSGQKKENFVEDHEPSMDPRSEAVAAADGSSESEIKPPKLSRKRKGNLVQGDEPSMEPVSKKVADGSRDSEVEVHRHSEKEKENLTKEDADSADPLLSKLDDETSDSEDKPLRRPVKKAAARVATGGPSRTKKGRKRLGGRGKSKIKTEDNSDAEKKQDTPGKNEEGSDSETKPLVQSGNKGITSRTRGQPQKKFGKKGIAAEAKLSKESTCNDDEDSAEKEDGERSTEKEQGTLAKNDGEGSDSETRPLVQSRNKEITSRPRGQPVKKSGKKGTAPEPKLSNEDTCNNDKNSSQEDGKRHAPEKNSKEKKEDRDSSHKDDGKRRALGKSKKEKKEEKDSSHEDSGKRREHDKNTKEKLLSKSHTKDDDQDMIISPKQSAKSVKDGDHLESPKGNSKRKRTSGKNKVSEDIEYGANLVGSKVKVWWPEDKEFYEGVIESYDSARKKHKVLYTDGEEERLVLQKEKWEFVIDETTQEEADEDPKLDTSAKSRSRKKAKTISESTPTQKQLDVLPPSRRSGAVASSKSKGTCSKSGGKLDSKSKDKPSKGSGKSEDDVGSDDEEAKSKHETPKTVTKSKGKTPQSGSKSNGSGTVKSSLSKRKDSGNTTGKASDAGKTTEAAEEGKSPDTAKAGKSGGKSGKKRKRGSRV